MAYQPDSDSDLVLHTYFRSSCSARVRIALELKGLPYTSVPVNLLQGAQRSDSYLALNPSGLVPCLQHVQKARTVTVTQSLAILEYLEEAFPEAAALLPPPSDPERRAGVRALASIIACDTQPVTNLRILAKIGSLGGSREEWAKEFMTDGLKAYEQHLATGVHGRFSVGDRVTLADVCLVPAVWGVLRFGVDLDALPLIKRIYEEISGLQAVKNAHWQNQEDTPQHLRQ